jgi:uncharacterized protein with FMN-binding domain
MNNKIILYCTLSMLLGFLLGCATLKIIGGPLPKNNLADGTYQGEAKNGPVSVLAEVTIKNQRIVKIDLLKHRNWKGKPAEQILARMIEEQSTSVDAVSGATTSSVTIMNAVEDAVRKAQK